MATGIDVTNQAYKFYSKSIVISHDTFRDGCWTRELNKTPKKSGLSSAVDAEVERIKAGG